MNKIRKLHKGMSLVEVLVAMTIFSVGAAAVTMAFASAVKFNTHNQRRDDELAIQEAAVQNGKNDGLELYGSSIGNDYEIVYTVKGGSKIKYTKKEKDKDSGLETDVDQPSPYRNATEFQAAKSGKNDTIFDFQLKSFSTTPVDSKDILVANKSEDEYKIRIENRSPISYDVRVETNGGTIYQGNYDGNGYKHSSKLYCHSLAPQMTDYDIIATKDPTPEDPSTTQIIKKVPSAFEFGYKYTGLAAVSQMDSPMTINFCKKGYLVPDKEYTLNIDKMTNGSASGAVLLIIQDDGNVKIEYPT
jgi:prepilin-type N-terminal cleavage/methylation domain-containing protein